jgi:D-3-phosphoglycerate dehydrogenase / 2-oxoglutarate reductase
VHTVLVTDAGWPSTDVEAEVLTGARVLRAPARDEETLLRHIPEADALLVGTARIGTALLSAAPELRIVARYGIGLDNVGVEEATRRGVVVTNAPGFCREEVAEHVLALLLCLARGVHLYDRAVRAGDWTRAGARTVRRVAGQTIGVVGFGAIGRTVAERAARIGMRVIVHDPVVADEAIRATGAEPVTLDDLARRADVVTLHTPLTEETRGLVNERFLAAMKPTAHLINTARGALVDQEALQAALAEGRIAGAGLDTFVPEPLPAGHPLLESERALLTPHVAFYSEESVHDVRVRAARAVAEALAGERPAETVNPAVFEHPRWS